MSFSKTALLLTIFVLFGLTFVVIAQDADTCTSIIEPILSTVDELCLETGRNQACYGNLDIEATVADDVDSLTFERPGDIVNLSDITALSLTGLDLDSAAWGVALLRVQANLPDTLPGQNVTMLLFGDVQLNDESENGTMQAFAFQSGIGTAACQEIKSDGILIQTPEGAGKVSVVANGVEIALGSTAFLEAQYGDSMTITLLEGEAEVTVGETTVTVPEGTEVSVPLDEDGQPTGPPSYPTGYDQDEADSLPTEPLPEPVEVADSVPAEEAPLFWQIPNTTLTTDPPGRMLYPRPVGDFVVETQLTFAPDHNYQAAGLYVQFDTGGRIEWVLAFCETASNPGLDCVDRGLYFDALASPGFSNVLAHAVLAYSDTTVWLQIENTGGFYRASYRTAASGSWTEFAWFESIVAVQEVGFVAQSASGAEGNPTGAPSITATFTDFTLRRPAED